MKTFLIGLILASAVLVGLGVWLMETATTPATGLLGAVTALLGVVNAIVNGWNLGREWRYL